MTLLWIIAVPLLAAPLAWWAGARRADAGWAVAMVAVLFDLALTVIWLAGPDVAPLTAPPGQWLTVLDAQWAPRFGIGFRLAADGLSILMVLLTLVLGVVAVGISRKEIRRGAGSFYMHMLLSVAGVLGVFLAVDLFLFFVFWEVMLVPMYFLISLWGHENRARSAIKFFIFTQASGLLMLLSILGLVWSHYQSSGELTFAYDALRGATLLPDTAFWLMLGFFIAFAVKLPAVPLHTWLPDAHTDAPTGGSVILAGILLKTGGYGLLRFVLPLFPEASATMAPLAMWLGAVAVLYGALMAFSQDDFKRLVAYSSVSHMGFVLIGIYALNLQAWQGTVMQMIAHGLSTGALFMIAGLIQARLHSRDLNRMGGLWQRMPVMGALALFFVVASVGMPGLANFIGEFLVLIGAFAASPSVAAVSALGLVGAAVYGLLLIQRSFQGPLRDPGGTVPRDLSLEERLLLAVMLVPVVVLGLYPQPVLDVASPWLESLLPLFPQGAGGLP